MSDTAVPVVDMLNAYRHEDAELPVPNVAEIVDPLAGLISVASDRQDVDVIDVNDNYGDVTFWGSQGREARKGVVSAAQRTALRPWPITTGVAHVIPGRSKRRGW